MNDLLARNGIPHARHDRESDLGRAVLECGGQASGHVVVWMPAIGGLCLVDPTDAEILEAWGIPTTLPEKDRDVDLLLVGAGPAGLALLSRPRRRKLYAPSSWNNRPSGEQAGVQPKLRPVSAGGLHGRDALPAPRPHP